MSEISENTCKDFSANPPAFASNEISEIIENSEKSSNKQPPSPKVKIVKIANIVVKQMSANEQE